MTLEEAHREHLLALIERQAAAIKHARIALEDAEPLPGHAPRTGGRGNGRRHRSQGSNEPAKVQDLIAAGPE